MVPVAVVGLWFVYRVRERLFVSQCRFMRVAVFALSAELSDALSCPVSVWPDIPIAGCRGRLCFSCSIIGRSRKISGALIPRMSFLPLLICFGAIPLRFPGFH